MIINRIDIVSFGKFKNKTIELNDGLNVISGKNESGKSTIAAFIYSMLYGFGDNRGKSISFRERFRPWSGGECEGSLLITHSDGKQYTIYRKTGVTKKHDVSAVYDALTGAKLDITPECLTDTDSETYLKTLFIKQNCSVFTGATKELSSRLSNLISGGDEEYNIKNALEILGSLRKEILSSRGSGELSEIYKKIENLNLKEEQLLAVKNEISLTEEELSKAEKKAEECSETLESISSQIENFSYESVIKENSSFSEKKNGASKKNNKLVFPISVVFSIFFLFLSLKIHILFSIFSLMFIFCSFKAYKSFSEQKEENATKIKSHLEKLNREYKSVQEEYINMKSYSAKLTQKLEQLRSVASEDNKVTLNNLHERRKELEKILNAVKLSEAALEETYDELVSGFIPDLNKKASLYFEEITDGKYSSLLSDADFNLSVGLTNPKSNILFSGGTIDQMYFALRLSLADLLFEEKPVCMIIDQPFMQYDEHRKNNAAQILSKISKNRQILLFIAEENNISALKSTEILT